MKHLILSLTFLLVSVFAFGQTKEELAAKDYFWGENDEYKSVIDIPEKWQNESAVVIYKNINYDFHKFGKNVKYTSSIRKRIKLLDNASVEEFSEFSFVKRFRSEKGRFDWKEKGETFVGVKIIKPNGSEKIIDVEADAVEVDGETKLAISNLEVGDIIDYYYHRVEPFKSTYAFGFDPVEVVLGEEYPIMDFKLFFETENDFFINFKSYNGAPELEELPTEKNNLRRYQLTATDVEKTEFPIWFYPLVELPAYKFQVYFARSGKFEDLALAFLPEKETIIKTSVSKEEVLDLYDKRLRPGGSDHGFKNFLKTNKFDSDAEKVRETYYFMRHMFMTRYVEAMYSRDSDILAYPFNYYESDAPFVSDQKRFVKNFTLLLDELDIDYEIVIAKKRFDGSIEDLLIEQNVQTLVKVKTSPTQYYEFFGLHTSDNHLSYYLEGTDIFTLSASRNKLDQIEEGRLPLSTYSDNLSNTETTLTVNEDFSGFNVESVHSFKGHEKTDEQSDRMYFKDYVNEDYERYGTKSLEERIKKKKTNIKFKKEFAALAEKIEKNINERYSNVAARALEVDEVENYDYKILETGRYGVDSEFKYSESYDAKNALIKKAGPNYILEVGKLIGGQIDIPEKDRKRDANIYQKYARTLHNKIILNIPDGYTASGLDKLNVDVDNATGTFKSNAKVEGNQLIINTTKAYKNSFEPVENWPMILEFLDAATQFTNEKVLLKKV